MNNENMLTRSAQVEIKKEQIKSGLAQGKPPAGPDTSGLQEEEKSVIDMMDSLEDEDISLEDSFSDLVQSHEATEPSGNMDTTLQQPWISNGTSRKKLKKYYATIKTLRRLWVVFPQFLKKMNTFPIQTDYRYQTRVPQRVRTQLKILLLSHPT